MQGTHSIDPTEKSTLHETSPPGQEAQEDYIALVVIELQDTRNRISSNNNLRVNIARRVLRRALIADTPLAIATCDSTGRIFISGERTFQSEAEITRALGRLHRSIDEGATSLRSVQRRTSTRGQLFLRSGTIIYPEMQLK